MKESLELVACFKVIPFSQWKFRARVLGRWVMTLILNINTPYINVKSLTVCVLEFLTIKFSCVDFKSKTVNALKVKQVGARNVNVDFFIWNNHRWYTISIPILTAKTHNVWVCLSVNIFEPNKSKLSCFFIIYCLLTFSSITFHLTWIKKSLLCWNCNI